MRRRRLRRQQVRALADLAVVAVGLLDALRVLLEILLAGAPAGRRRAASGAEAGDAEALQLGHELRQRLGVLRRLDLLALVEVLELEVELEIGRLRGAAGALRHVE